MIDTHVPEGEIDLGPSRTQKRHERKRTQANLDELTQLLASIPPRVLAGLALDEELHEAVLAYKRLPHGGASARQRRLVARMLRGHEPDALAQRVRLALGGTK